MGEKKLLWKAWKRSKASKKEYLVAKRASKHDVYAEKIVAEEKKFACIKDHEDEIFKFFKHMKKCSQNVVGESCILDDN